MDQQTERQLLDTLNNINNHLVNITRNSGNRSYGNNQGSYYPSYSSGYYGNYSQSKELRPSADNPGFSRSDLLYKNDFKYDERKDIFDNIFEQYEKVIVNSLITSFGLDAFINDLHGGDVDTIHNVREIDKDPEMHYKNQDI